MASVYEAAAVRSIATPVHRAVGGLPDRAVHAGAGPGLDVVGEAEPRDLREPEVRRGHLRHAVLKHRLQRGPIDRRDHGDVAERHRSVHLAAGDGIRRRAEGRAEVRRAVDGGTGQIGPYRSRVHEHEVNATGGAQRIGDHVTDQGLAQTTRCEPHTKSERGMGMLDMPAAAS